MSPYIKGKRERELLFAGSALPRTPGELAYLITANCLSFLAATPTHPSYTTYAQIVGILETVKLEMYRRAVAPYEDRKKEENGDVF